MNYLPVNFANVLKSRLIFNICYCFLFRFLFFSIRVFFHGHWQLTRQKGGGIFYHRLFVTTSTHSQTFRHLFATLDVRWLSHIFNRTACSYHHLIELPFDLWCEVFICVLDDLRYYDTRFLLQQSWYGKPVDSNSHRLLHLYCKQTD